MYIDNSYVKSVFRIFLTIDFCFAIPAVFCNIASQFISFQSVVVLKKARHEYYYFFYFFQIKLFSHNIIP